jgi:ubiquitin-protein ligase
MENVSITLPSETDITTWHVTIIGAKNTPYSNGKFNIQFQFPEEYPFRPPFIRYLTQIYHPNVKSDTGEICASLINDEWGPTLNVRTCIDIVKNMMKDPSSDNPLEESIAVILRDKPSEFEKTAKKWTKDFAK